MKWNHLPEDGGVNRQHPVLMDRFAEIHSAIAKKQAQERAKQEREAGRKTGKRPRMRG